ncbi:hypothetical protein GGQ68_002525 [Sagittula marina]|uniref:Uncharacterized protein n=1 Tax=Sagittula marina TaxID=943940 RepID=A0A7W6DSN4_9RHOB|nr:hypothetical protein [Sagittula marina]
MRRAVVTLLRRYAAPAIEWTSVEIHWLIYRDRSMSLCARAWVYREHLFWRAWVAVFDTLLLGYEPDHCRASAERCGR